MSGFMILIKIKGDNDHLLQFDMFIYRSLCINEPGKADFSGRINRAPQGLCPFRMRSDFLF